MRAFFLLVNFRLKEVRTNPTTGFIYFGLPMLLLLVTGVIFSKGPPFEKRTISLVTLPGHTIPESFLNRLKQFKDLRWQMDSSKQIAINKLHAHTVNAVIVFGEGRPSITVGTSDELFGFGIQTILPESSPVEVLDRSRWGYVHYLFPGLLTWTIIIDGLFGMGYSMVHYRRNRFLKKLSLTPLPKFTFVGAQIVSRSILAFLQMVLMVVVASLIFELPMTLPAVAWLACLTLLGLMVFMGLGFTLACAIKTEVNMLDTVNAVTVVIILVSEIFFSADELPDLISKFSSALPSTQLVRLIRSIVLYSDTEPSRLIPGLIILVGWMIATYVISVIAFKWHE